MNFFKGILFILASHQLAAVSLDQNFPNISPQILSSSKGYQSYSTDSNREYFRGTSSTSIKRNQMNSSNKIKRQLFGNSAKITPRKSKFPIVELGGRKLRQLLTTTTTANDFHQRIIEENNYSAIPGIPGVHYPIYAEVPPTSFDCLYQEFPGYYADLEAQCQVFHICALNRTYSFLCPNGTIFSQAVLVCVWWHQYDCSISPILYSQNAYIYDYGDKIDKTKFQQRTNFKYFNQSEIQSNIAVNPNTFLTNIPGSTPLSTQIPSINHQIDGRVLPSIIKPPLIGSFGSTLPTTALPTSSTRLRNFLAYGLKEPKLSYAPVVPSLASIDSQIPSTNVIDRFRASKILKPIIVDEQFDIQNVESKVKLPTTDDTVNIISNMEISTTQATFDRRYLPPPIPPAPSVYQSKRRVKRF